MEVILLNLLKALFLFIGILFTCVNTAKAYNREKTTAHNFFAQAIGLTCFIMLQFVL